MTTRARAIHLKHQQQPLLCKSRIEAPTGALGIRLFIRLFKIRLNSPSQNDHIFQGFLDFCVDHTAWALKGREGRSQEALIYGFWISCHILGLKRATRDMLVSKHTDCLGLFRYLRMSHDLSIPEGPYSSMTIYWIFLRQRSQSGLENHPLLHLDLNLSHFHHLWSRLHAWKKLWDPR